MTNIIASDGSVPRYVDRLDSPGRYKICGYSMVSSDVLSSVMHFLLPEDIIRSLGSRYPRVPGYEKDLLLRHSVTRFHSDVEMGVVLSAPDNFYKMSFRGQRKSSFDEGFYTLEHITSFSILDSDINYNGRSNLNGRLLVNCKSKRSFMDIPAPVDITKWQGIGYLGDKKETRQMEMEILLHGTSIGNVIREAEKLIFDFCSKNNSMIVKDFQ